MFKSAQLRFFRAALDIIQVCDFHDPSQVAREVEQIGKDSMNVQFLTGYEPEVSYSTSPGYGELNSNCSMRSDESSNTTPRDNPPANAPWMSSSSSTQEVKPPPPSPPSSPTTKAKVLYDYTALDHTEINLAFGEIITVEEKHSSGWWTGTKSNGTKGLFPSNYVQVLP